MSQMVRCVHHQLINGNRHDEILYAREHRNEIKHGRKNRAT